MGRERPGSERRIAGFGYALLLHDRNGSLGPSVDRSATLDVLLGGALRGRLFAAGGACHGVPDGHVERERVGDSRSHVQTRTGQSRAGASARQSQRRDRICPTLWNARPAVADADANADPGRESDAGGNAAADANSDVDANTDADFDADADADVDAHPDALRLLTLPDRRNDKADVSL
jgi:hypothetical protein